MEEAAAQPNISLYSTANRLFLGGMKHQLCAHTSQLAVKQAADFKGSEQQVCLFFWMWDYMLIFPLSSTI